MENEKEKEKVDETDAQEDAEKVEKLAEEEHEDAKKDEGKDTSDRDKVEADDKKKEDTEMKEMIKDLHGKMTDVHNWFKQLVESQADKSDAQVEQQEPETKQWTKEEIEKFAKGDN